jgi:hypothetical protein
MMVEWLTEKCATTDPCEIRLQEMASLELSDANKQEIINRSEQFKLWVETKWNPFIAEMITGDELWKFRSPAHTWANMAGRAGFAIVRGGKILRSLVTLLN